CDCAGHLLKWDCDRRWSRFLSRRLAGTVPRLARCVLCVGFSRTRDRGARLFATRTAAWKNGNRKYKIHGERLEDSLQLGTVAIPLSRLRLFWSRRKQSLVLGRNVRHARLQARFDHYRFLWRFVDVDRRRAGYDSRRLFRRQVSTLRTRRSHAVWRTGRADRGAVLVVVYLFGKSADAFGCEPGVARAVARVAWTSGGGRSRHGRSRAAWSRHRCLLLRRDHRLRHRLPHHRPAQRLARRHHHTTQHALLDAALPARMSGCRRQSLSGLSRGNETTVGVALCGHPFVYWRDTGGHRGPPLQLFINSEE